MHDAQPQQTTELWNLTGTHIHMGGNSVGSHSYAQVKAGRAGWRCRAGCCRSLVSLEKQGVFTRCPVEGSLASLFELTVMRTLQGSLIPGSNYSAQDDHAGVRVAGM